MGLSRLNGNAPETFEFHYASLYRGIHVGDVELCHFVACARAGVGDVGFYLDIAVGQSGYAQIGVGERGVA